MTPEPCADPRLTLGAGLSALASALVAAAWPGWVGVGLILGSALVLLGTAAWALRARPPVTGPAVAVEAQEPPAVRDALRAL
ncbi:MAG: hypothetical protein ACO3UW_11945, partial [Candidatus Nanopelagicales bacterium]